jgi:hypothetical protein
MQPTALETLSPEARAIFDRLSKFDEIARIKNAILLTFSCIPSSDLPEESKLDVITAGLELLSVMSKVQALNAVFDQMTAGTVDRTMVALAILGLVKKAEGQRLRFLNLASMLVGKNTHAGVAG